MVAQEEVQEEPVKEAQIQPKEKLKEINLGVEMGSQKPVELVVHSLIVDMGVKLVIQPVRVFHTDVEAQITQKVKKLLTVGFIKPIHHLKWLSNIVPKRKRMVKSVVVWTFAI